MKKPVKFKAEMPLLIVNKWKHKKVLFRDWVNLPQPEQRREPNRHKAGYTYYRVTPVPPYDNPAVAKVIKKLRWKRVPFTRMEIQKPDGVWIIISTY